MKYFINSTADYHQHDLNSLGWELTVCNSLEPLNSPCRKALTSPYSFGKHLYNFLSKIIPFNDIRSVLEMGGGMGYLMRDFLTLNPKLRAKMIDISPYLLDKQKEMLQSLGVDFELADILTVSSNDLFCFDLAIMNENLGDLPTLVAEQIEENNSDQNTNNILGKLEHFNKKYNLPLGLNEKEHINIGAMEIVEKLCLAGIKYIYLSEHSCEAVVPEEMKPYLSFPSSGIPEMISLKGHKEFTIKFSYLQKIAKMLHYKTRRGAFADFLPLNLNDKVKTALRLTTSFNDEQEIVRQFFYDIYKYEYLILIKGDEK
ncbi:MAG: class I SAM-dependent methyltransferase [Deltaproteobacteria bacterium]|nr:class I SAM-dependent methyltransferase [Deltaproteobacteria bacterium]